MSGKIDTNINSETPEASFVLFGGSISLVYGAEPSVLYREASLCISMGQNQVSLVERCPYVLVWGRTKCPL